jgi:hypothetical protein
MDLGEWRSQVYSIGVDEVCFPSWRSDDTVDLRALQSRLPPSRKGIAPLHPRSLNRSGKPWSFPQIFPLSFHPLASITPPTVLPLFHFLSVESILHLTANSVNR